LPPRTQSGRDAPDDATTPLPSGRPQRVQRLKESNVAAKYFFTIKEVNSFFIRPEIRPAGRPPGAMWYVCAEGFKVILPVPISTRGDHV
jgi:hypothetical protein